MAPLFLLLLLLPLFPTFHGSLAAPLYEAGNAHFSTQSDASNSNSSSSSSFWLSDNGNLTFGFKTLGSNQYLLCIWITPDTQQTPLWWPNLANPILTQGATLSFTSNGNLELSDANQRVLWSTPVSNASFATLQNTGNLQLLDRSTERILWHSFSDLRDSLIVRPRADDNSTDSLSSIVVDKPHLLRSRSNDTSYASGRFHAQTDEDYNVYLHALDEAHSVDFIYVYASMNVSDDVFELTQDYGKTYRDNSSMPMSMLRLDPDGNLRIYAWNDNSSTWDRIWQFIDDTCKLGSPCGPYSICKESANGSVSCACPTGYQAVDNRSASLGCYTNNLNLSSICEEPSANTSNGLFYMAENKQSDYYYNDLSSQRADDVEACKELCLNDCDCIAASYRSGTAGTCFLKGNSTTGLLMNGYATNGNTLLMKLLVSSAPPGASIASSRGGVNKGVIIGAVVAVTVVAMLVATAAITWLLTRRGRGYYGSILMFGKPVRGDSWNGEMIDAAGPTGFTYQQLVEATHNFRELLGEGGFGHVYRGTILVRAETAGESKQLPVAVKVLKSTKHSRQGEAEKQFRAEASTLGKIHHINLVHLLGYCIAKRDADYTRILVYEYIENGSLASFLSHNAKPHELSWGARYAIAVGTARGIAYLHHDCNPPILHCDIKPQNVLLDHDFTAKVADFGLARRLEEVKSHLTMSGIRGTRGYMAPEWLMTDELTSKADVYSYGMVLLELVRGFHHGGNDDDKPLVDWAHQFILSTEPAIPVTEEEGAVKIEQEDPDSHTSHIEDDHDDVKFQKEESLVSIPNRLQTEKVGEMSEQIRLVKVGLWCVQYEPHLRPSMLRVLHLIDGNGDDISIPPSIFNHRTLPSLGSELYSSTMSTNTPISYVAEDSSIMAPR